MIAVLAALSPFQPPKVPRPDPVDLNFQREAEHDADGDDHPEHAYALHGRIDDDGADDVTDDEHLEAEENRLPKLSAEPPVPFSWVAWLQHRERVFAKRQ